jgi:hypothetical protein
MKTRLLLIPIVVLVACIAVDGVILLARYLHIAQERNNIGYGLRYILGDLSSYSAAYDRLPPAVIRDREGQPQSSWRFATAAMLLNDAVQTGYYGQDCRGDLPWDCPENRRYLDGPYRDYGGSPLSYIDPSRPGNKARFVAVVGPGTAFDDDQPHRIEEVPGNALLVVETRGCRAHWMEPGGDLDIRTMPRVIGADGGIGPATGGRPEFYIGFADRSVWLVRSDVPFETLSRFFTIEEARQQDRDLVLRPYANQVWK